MTCGGAGDMGMQGWPRSRVTALGALGRQARRKAVVGRAMC